MSFNNIENIIKMDNRKELVKFLRELSNSIENNDIEDKKLLEISKFFMKFKFYENGVYGEYEKDEMVKYMSLGWYIYTYILKK